MPKMRVERSRPQDPGPYDEANCQLMTTLPGSPSLLAPHGNFLDCPAARHTKHGGGEPRELYLLVTPLPISVASHPSPRPSVPTSFPVGKYGDGEAHETLDSQLRALFQGHLLPAYPGPPSTSLSRLGCCEQPFSGLIPPGQPLKIARSKISAWSLGMYVCNILDDLGVSSGSPGCLVSSSPRAP